MYSLWKVKSMLFFWHGLANVKWSNLYVVWTQECLCVWHPPRWGELIFANKLLLYHVLKHSLGIFETLKILLQKVFKALISKKKKKKVFSLQLQTSTIVKRNTKLYTQQAPCWSTAQLPLSTPACISKQKGPYYSCPPSPSSFKIVRWESWGRQFASKKG